jgi:Protein of unknown function (DUF3467)
MNQPQPDPSEGAPAVRARVPESVGRGVFSTGVIVMTGNTEFILDFVQNLGRPHQIVARIVMPHLVLPQFVEALATNIELYRQRYGALPAAPPSSVMISSSPTAPAMPPQPPSSPPTGDPGAAAQAPQSPSPPQQPQPNVRRPTAQEVYDDLKLRDELLSGSYANAVMIGHGPHEFSFDFITNFFPQSAVSSRVFLSSGQITRLLDSLKTAWEQTRPRLNPGWQNPQQRPPETPPMSPEGEHGDFPPSHPHDSDPR